MKTFVARALPALLLLVLAVPTVVLGQGNVPNLTGGKIGQVFQAVIAFINGILVPTVFAIAFLVFIWGVFKTFILGGHDEEKQSEGKSLMIYAIIGFVVMVSIWGIVNLVASGFGLTDQTIGNIPTVPQPR